MRKLAACAAAVVLGAAGLVVVTEPPDAAAHGAEVFPGSRQYLCWVDGQTGNGQVDPSNPACADAYAADGTNSFYNWFGNLDSNGAGRTEGYIPDGQICDGGGSGPYDFSSFNAARDDWPTTHLTAGETYEFQHNNWAEHPGRFDVYVTTQGFDPTQPLGWDDLELVDTVTDPPDTGGPGALNYYYWDVTMPADRSGKHIVFTHWVRSDSNENFYSCSDVAFDGGNGEVTGIGDDVPEPSPTPTPTLTPEPEDCPDAAPLPPATPPGASSITTTKAHIMWGLSPGGCVTGFDVLDVGTGEVVASTDGIPMVDLEGLEPDTEYTVTVRSRNDNTGAVSAETASVTFTTLADDVEPTPTPTPEPEGECTVDYAASHWGGGNSGYTASVTVTNTSDAPATGWVLEFEYPGGQRVDVPGWSATLTQSGTSVTATHPGWATSIPAGGSATFGFNGQTSGSGHPEPTGFTLNGATCS